MVIIGTDSHKRTHTFVVVDEVGKKIGEKTLAATVEGHLDALTWAERWPERRWALEDCRHLTRRLESDLLSAGEAVVRVPTKLMAAERRGDRERGKSDPIDALAVARAALREADLPVARLDVRSRELKLLVDHREDLVRERTRMQARLRWHLHELFPGLVIAPRSLRRKHVFAELEARLEGADGTVARIARELLASITALTSRVNELEREIGTLVRDVAPSLLSLRGCAWLSAAKVVGETASASRFKSRAAYARWNGTAPIPVWSGSTNFRPRAAACRGSTQNDCTPSSQTAPRRRSRRTTTLPSPTSPRREQSKRKRLRQTQAGSWYLLGPPLARVPGHSHKRVHGHCIDPRGAACPAPGAAALPLARPTGDRVMMPRTTTTPMVARCDDVAARRGRRRRDCIAGRCASYAIASIALEQRGLPSIANPDERVPVSKENLIMMTDTEVQSAIAAEYTALADLLGSLPSDIWGRPSLCEDWRVREVVAHVTMAARYGTDAFMEELRARNFDFDRLSNEIAAEDGALPPSRLLADLRSETLHQWVPPEGGVHGALNHAVIHSLDVSVPLGNYEITPAETMQVVLDDLTAGQIHKHFGTLIDGRRLGANDLDWAYGSGKALRASGAILALLLCGRKLSSDHFEGDPI
jgi:transposase